MRRYRENTSPSTTTVRSTAKARGGCSCAGPYGHRLLGIDAATSSKFEREITLGCEVIKPGWVRVNFNYFISEEEFQFIVDAMHLIARDGWRLLPLYRFDAETALWRHRDGIPEPPMTLESVDFRSGEIAGDLHMEPETRFREYLASAEAIMADAGLPSDPVQPLTDDAEALRWFALPSDVGTS